MTDAENRNLAPDSAVEPSGEETTVSPRESLSATRRTILRTVATTLAVPLVPGLSPEQVVALGLESHAHAHNRAVRARESASEARSMVVLSDGQQSLLELFTETLLPRTETPGATDAGVVGFIDTMLDGWFPAPARDRYLDQLGRFERETTERFGKSFVDCDSSQRSELVADSERRAIEQRGGKSFSSNPDALAEADFFDVTKWLTVYGYFTSEVVLRETLGYRIVPGRYDGAVPRQNG